MVAFWALLVVLLASPLRDSPGVWPNPGDLLTPARRSPAMKPYYQTDDGSIRIFHARWEDVLAAGVFKPKDIALVHADPPYGINYTAERKRGRPSAKRSANGNTWGKDWKRITDDNKPFDPSSLLSINCPTVLWGANNYANALPNSGGWLVWDKKKGGTASQGHHASDAELAWTNMGRCVDLFSYFWDGFRREGEILDHWHPTQKPEALSEFVFGHAEKRKKLKRGDTVLIPYMGSFPDARPAMVRGYKVIACEVAREYCDTAINARLRAVVKPIENAALGPLFGAV